MILGQNGNRTRNGSNGIIFCREPEYSALIQFIYLILIMLSLVLPISEYYMNIFIERLN